MKDEEEYLEQLLQAALNKGKAKVTEEAEPEEAEASFDASETLKNLASDSPKKDIGSGALPSFRQVVDAEEKGEDLAESFKQTEEIPELSDVSDVMSLFGEVNVDEEIIDEDEIVDLSEFKNLGKEEPAEPEYIEEEPAYEETEEAEEEPVYDDPERELTADEIAAMYAAEPEMYGEEAEDAIAEEPEYTEEVTAEEEPVYEEAAVEEEPVYEDAASVEEPVVEEEPAVEEQAFEDMPAEEKTYEDDQYIEGSPVYEEEPAAEEAVIEEEPVFEEEAVSEEAPVADDDPNRQLSPEEIAAMFDAGMDDMPTEEAADRSDDDMADELMALLDEADGITAPEEAPAAADVPVDEIPDLGLDDLSLDDIESRMREAEAAGEEALAAPADEEEDVTALLESLGSDDMDLSDIGDILKKSDNNEIVDQSITEQPDGEMPEDPLADEAEAQPAEGEEGEEEQGKKKKKKLFGKKKKKGEEDEEGGNKEKKPNFFTKLLDLLIKEEDEEEVPESQSLRLSDENKAILDELDKEAEEEGKGKKKKKEKKPKKEKPKKEKKSKPKKEKKVKPKVEENTKKIPKKYVRRTFILAASILVALLVVTLYLPGMKTMEDARKSFYEKKDYKNVFLTFYGKELNESDMKIYRQSRMVVLLDRKYESYENYKRMNMQEEALDALLQGLKRYDELQEEAIELGMGAEIIGVRGNILEALYRDYGIDELTAYDILGYSTLDYTGKIKATVNGQPYTKIEDEMRQKYGLAAPVQETVPEPVIEEDNGELPDMLPEEQQYLEQKDAEPAPEEPAPEERDLPAEAEQGGRDVPVQIDSDQF